MVPTSSDALSDVRFQMIGRFRRERRRAAPRVVRGAKTDLRKNKRAA
jgi:hypothetical protein